MADVSDETREALRRALTLADPPLADAREKRVRNGLQIQALRKSKQPPAPPPGDKGPKGRRSFGSIHGRRK
jgi:hypothetical protein